jgi:hypothetical protein
MQRDAIPVHFAARQGDDLKDDFVDVRPVFPRWRFLDEGADPVDDFAGSIAVVDLLTQLAALELHNGFTAAGGPTFAGRSEIKTQATLGDLREASPEVDEELNRRLKAKSANE